MRIICPNANSMQGGASNFVRIIPGGEVSVGGVPLGVIPPSVKSLAVTVSPTTLAGPGATAQLSVVTTFSDGSTRPVTNGDEDLYPNQIVSFTKTLPHNENGEVELPAYTALLNALTTGQHAAFEAVPLGGRVKLARSGVRNCSGALILFHEK